jgi:adenylyltransferase/sulfurtransferase
MILTGEEQERYRRHLGLCGFGAEAQLALKAARVLVIGAGGLGVLVLLYLAAAGVGHLTIIDDDVVDLTNLQRQVIYTTADVGKKKAQTARERLLALNPLIQVVIVAERLTRDNADNLFAAHDLIIDGSDNFPTRYLANDTAVRHRKPLVYGAVDRFEGQLSVFAPHFGTACYRCLFPQEPPPGLIQNCVDGGVLGVVPGLIGLYQATEAIKVLCGLGEPAWNRLLHIDLLTLRTREIKLRRDPQCVSCHDVEITPMEKKSPVTTASITITEFAEWRKKSQKYTLIDVREPDEWAAGHLPEAHKISLSQIAASAEKIRALPKPIVLQCKAGGRSAQAQQQLIAAGLSETINLTGGLDAWISQFGRGDLK